ncbi:MAG: SUMF1/EgtB/PvdO family nonheme iron enzyme [Candidatus Eutrophobiaceae bacterium]
MNPFDQELHVRRKRQLTLLTCLAIVIAILMAIGLAVAFLGSSAHLEIMPEEAANTAEINVTHGLARLSNKRIYALSGNIELRISAPGFMDEALALERKEIKNTLRVSMKDAPVPVRLRIDSVPADKAMLDNAVWRLNGAAASAAVDRLERELLPGQYQLAWENPYFEVYSMDFKLRRNTPVNETFSPMRVRGKLDLKTTPTGATVFLNGQKIGQTPLQAEWLSGEHDLRIEMALHEEIQERIVLNRAEREIKRDYRMRERLGASLQVTVSPSGGILTLDGVEIQASKYLPVRTNAPLTLSYDKKGYVGKTLRLQVAANEARKASISLELQQGSLLVQSTPPGAAVYLDKQKIGAAPVHLPIDGTTHVISVRKRGYLTQTRRIALSHDKINTAEDFSLKPLPTQYTNAAGGQMLLFRPTGEFKMGASRGEPGQRANERIRTIRLDRPFYVGMHEVTNAALAKFDPALGKGTGNHPATGLSWEQAALFCNWLSAKAQLNPYYQIANGKITGFDLQSSGYRLPTEPEWEWLARRAGRIKGTQFVWGNSTVIPNRAANIADESAKGSVSIYVSGYNDSFATAAPVGSFIREPSGLYDQAGNVSEWTNDLYSLVPMPVSTVEIDPVERHGRGEHVIKGANWRSGSTSELRAAYRKGVSTGKDDIGFRVARYLIED